MFEAKVDALSDDVANLQLDGYWFKAVAALPFGAQPTVFAKGEVEGYLMQFGCMGEYYPHPPTPAMLNAGPEGHSVIWTTGVLLSGNRYDHFYDPTLTFWQMWDFFHGGKAMLRNQEHYIPAPLFRALQRDAVRQVQDWLGNRMKADWARL